MDVFNYQDYRSLINDWEKTQTDRGTRSRLAAAAQCSPSWITRVLTGSVQLTPDQGYGIGTFMNFNESETDYFLLLIEIERAASSALKKRIQKKLDNLKRESHKISSVVKTSSSVSEEHAIRYYSSWIYSALHVACMIRPQSIEELAAFLNVPRNVVVDRVKNLKEMALLKAQGLKWVAQQANIHLPADHPASNITHSSWRNRTIQRFNEGNEDGFHYSAVHCLSHDDMESVRKLLRKSLLNCRDVIEKSSSETLGVLCVDWYGI